MTESIHPVATQHLPFFLAVPGQTDTLFVVMAVTVVLAAVGIGIFYFKLHALPEHLAHGGQKVQMEIVAVLALISLFTHNHAFWIAGLLLALIPLPDFVTPLTSVARSLDRLAASAEAAVPAAPPVQEAPLPAADRPTVQQGA